jgi:hypothetical protein
MNIAERGVSELSCARSRSANVEGSGGGAGAGESSATGRIARFSTGSCCGGNTGTTGDVEIGALVRVRFLSRAGGGDEAAGGGGAGRCGDDAKVISTRSDAFFGVGNSEAP